MEGRVYPVFFGIFADNVVHDYLSEDICHCIPLAFGSYHVVHGCEHGAVYYVEFVAVPLVRRKQLCQVLLLEEQEVLNVDERVPKAIPYLVAFLTNGAIAHVLSDAFTRLGEEKCPVVWRENSSLALCVGVDYSAICFLIFVTAHDNTKDTNYKNINGTSGPQSNRMARTITTVSVHAERAEALREYRDDHDLPSMDAALAELLSRHDVAISHER